MAVGSARDNLAPEFVGSRTKRAHEYIRDPSLDYVIIALEHALETIHCSLRDTPAGLDIWIAIYSDNDLGLGLIRKAVENRNLWREKRERKAYITVLNRITGSGLDTSDNERL